MTSEARKQAWLAAIAAPAEIQDVLPWAYAWKFRRRSAANHAYHLALIAETRTFQVFVRPPWLMHGTMPNRADHLAPLLRSLLTEEQLAAAIAAILTRNNAEGTPQ